MNSKPTKTWTKAQPIRQKDSIVSSEVVQHRERAFIPSYEKDPKEFMNYLMTNEYMRIWFKERGVYENAVYTKKLIQKEQSHIVRKFVQRDWRRRIEEKPLPIIYIKKFQNVACKTDYGQFREKQL